MNEQKWDGSQIPDQSGKIVVVTGSSSGIGYEAARVLANKGAKVIIAVRNDVKGSTAVEKIKGQNENADVEVMLLDLSEFESINKFVNEYKSKFDRLDILINNAGVMVPPYSKTKEGFSDVDTLYNFTVNVKTREARVIFGNPCENSLSVKITV